MTLAFCDTDSISQIASAIRLKGGTSASMSFPSGFVDGISNIDKGFITQMATNDWPSGELSTSVYTIAAYAFTQKRAITKYNGNNCMYIFTAAFSSCRGLSEAIFPQCKMIDASGFYGCISLTSISFPLCSIIGNGAFEFCLSLPSVRMPELVSMSQRAFTYCSKMTTATFNKLAFIGASAFSNCIKLESLNLTGSSLCSLETIYTFYNTPLSNSAYLGRYGSIYVPSSLVDSYKASTNWALYSSRITAI